MAPGQNMTGNYPLLVTIDNKNISGPVVTYIPDAVIKSIHPSFSIARYSDIWVVYYFSTTTTNNKVQYIGI